MSKYIDAERLIAEVKRRMDAISEDCKNSALFFDFGRINGMEEILSIIASLQQEKPKVDLVAQLKHHFATTPKEQLEKEWKELEPWTNIGPTVQEFLYGKQHGADLEGDTPFIPAPETSEE